MITTAFKIDLIDPAIGMKEFTTQRRTPITISDRTICSNGMTTHLLDNFEDQSRKFRRPAVRDCTSALVHRFAQRTGATFIHEVSGMTTIVIVLLALLLLGAFFVMFLGGV
jgi:hypothetical protein